VQVQWKVPVPRKGHQKGKRTNVVYIIADDLGIHDLSFGTPAIDSIAKRGIRFVNAYATQATCAPSRASIFTGRNPTDIGFEFTPVPIGLSRAMTILEDNPIHPPVYHIESLFQLPDFADMTIPNDVPTLAEELHEYGYDNYLIGKWHLGHSRNHTPLERGFDETLTFPVGFSSYLPQQHPDLVEIPLNGSFAMFDKFLRYNLPFTVSHNNGPPFPPDEYMTDYLSNRAVDLIHTLKDSPNPFFVALTFTAPHSPLQALRSDVDQLNDTQLHLTNATSRVYAAMIKALDRGVGRVLDALNSTGQSEDTLVIFTSDNGGAHYLGLPAINYPYRGWKGTFFEGGIRVPLVLQWPKHIAQTGTESAQVVSLRDLFPFIVNVAAATARTTDNNSTPLIPSATATIDPIEENTVGYHTNNLLSSLSLTSHTNHTTNNMTNNDHLFWRVGHYKALRIGAWKLQLSDKPSKVWFHNLQDDPYEHVNLAVELGMLEPHLIPLEQHHYHDSEARRRLLFTHCTSMSRYADQVALLSAIYQELLFVNTQQTKPRWPAMVELAISIDKCSAEPSNELDEYVYTVN